jgi:threonylcarbamoyladenosine tRNA methylthiotransferase MtaB
MQRAAGDSATGADVVILNTCTVTHNADREARQIVRRLRRANPRALLIATGCYAERDAAAVAALPELDHVVGLHEGPARITALAAAATGLRLDAAAPPLGRFGTTDGCDPLPDPGDRTRVYLKIQDGCDLRCSYCIIPSVRGGSRHSAGNVLARCGGWTRRLWEIVSRRQHGRFRQDLDPLTTAARASRIGAPHPPQPLEPRTATPETASTERRADRAAFQIPCRAAATASAPLPVPGAD